MILEALHRIVNHRESLSRDEARIVMGEVLSGNCTDAQISALLVGLHMKGETVEEIVGFAEAIRAEATPIPARANSVLDASGTGHEALGVNIGLPPALLAECLREIGIAFLFAPAIHSAVKYVAPVRRETRLRTV